MPPAPISLEHTSPFDINVAIDAGFDVVVPYANVKLEQVGDLTHDIIYARKTAGIQHTAVFIGGREIDLTMEMAAIWGIVSRAID